MLVCAACGKDPGPFSFHTEGHRWSKRIVTHRCPCGWLSVIPITRGGGEIVVRFGKPSRGKRSIRARWRDGVWELVLEETGPSAEGMETTLEEGSCGDLVRELVCEGVLGS